MKSPLFTSFCYRKHTFISHNVPPLFKACTHQGTVSVFKHTIHNMHLNRVIHEGGSQRQYSNSSKVAVFWDIENCPLPRKVAADSLIKELFQLARYYGKIATCRAYCDLSMPFPKSATLRSSGVKLVDCRHEGRKDVADKALKEDMLAYAAHNPAPITILLISGDHGFTDSVRTLAQQGYHIVLFAPTAANQDLKAQANVVHAWPQDVIPKFGNLTIRANAT